MNGGKVFVLKKIGLEDTEMYRRLTEVNSEYVARVYGTALVEDEFYAVLEFVQGTTLENHVREHGFMTDGEMKEVILQVCGGLEAIHALGIIHRDINPNNIMLDENGRVKIIDFGISRIEKKAQSSDTQLLGTQGFAPPEQYGFSQTSVQSDIYSVGVLMNYLKTGCVPSEKTDGGAFAPVIIKCTQMDAGNRYRSTVELAADIEKKKKWAGIIRSIPGFRKDIWWHKLIAMLYYFAAALLVFAPEVHTDKGLSNQILQSVAMFFLFLVPVPILLNMGGWTEKWSFTRNRVKSSKMFARFFFAGVSWLISMFLILISE